MTAPPDIPAPDAPAGHRPRMPGPALALAAACLAAPAPAAAAAPLPAETPARYTPAVASVMSTPRWFRDPDGRRHLVYELALTNGFPVPVTITEVAVRDAGGHGLAVLRGARLRAAASLMASPRTPATALPGSATGVVWMDLPLARGARIPRALAHRVTVRVPAGLPVPRTIALTGARARVDVRPPVVIGPPLAGTGWAAIGSCCDGPHRRALQPVDGRLRLGQRFAIDFNRLDGQGRLIVGDRAQNASYPTYDQPVLAVADARVVAAVDRFPDQVPEAPRPVGLAAGSGNHVVLDLGGGRFAEYAHLRPGSVAVRRGDRVRRGQVIGRTGNSGSSDGPHLHFQVMDAPSAVDSDGLPYAFAAFDLQGRTPPLAALVPLAARGAPFPVDTQAAGPRTAALPLGRDVVAFPAVPSGR